MYFNEVFFRFKDSVKAKDERRALPEVIFLDWNMPGLSGEQCLKAIRKIQRLDNIPVIVFTTSTAEQDKKNALSLGASSFITKPPNLRDLTILLKGIFSAKGRNEHFRK